MKKALNAWTVNGALDMEQTFHAVAEAGFDAIELNVDAPGAAHGLSLDTTKADFAAIRGLSEKYHLPVASISSSLWGARMGIAANHRDAEALLWKQVEAAKELGANGILTVPGGMGGGVTIADVRRDSVAFLKAMRADIEKEGIFVGLENVWNGFFLSPYDMVSVIDEVGSAKIGAYLDAGNMLAFSVPEYWIEILGSRIGKVHVKDYKRAGGLNSGGTWEDITHGSADWKVIIPALRKAGYDGYLVGEVDKSDESMAWEDYYKKVCGEIATICAY